MTLEQANAEAVDNPAWLSAPGPFPDGDHFASLLQNLPGCAYRCPLHEAGNGALLVEHVSDGVQGLSGYAAEDFWSGRVSWRNLVHPDDISMIRQEVSAAIEERRSYSLTYRITHKTDREIWVLDRGHAAYDEDGAPLWLEGFVSDITDQKETEAALRDSEEQLRAMLDAQPECVMVSSAGGRVVKVNPAGVAMLGCTSASEVVGRSVLTFIDPDHQDAVRDLHMKCLEGIGHDGPHELDIMEIGGKARRAEVRLAPLKSSDGKVWAVLSVARDITDRKRAEEKMEWLATHDPLTGLPNRALFQQRLKRVTDQEKGAPAKAGLLIIDLDNFKQVNDTLGHDAGDILLCETARRIRDCGRPSWTVARLGGDEFAVIVPNVRDRVDFTAIVETFLRSLREPVSFGGKMLDSRASIGATLFPDDDRAPSDLLKNADLALYAAKAAGRGRAMLYAPAMRSEMQRRVMAIRQFKTALAEDRVIAYYQPKIALDDGALIGFEALLRWQGEDGRIQRPGSAASAFEDAELAAAISDRMIGKVLDDMQVWLDRDHPFGHVAVNISALEFRQPDFAARLLNTLEMRGIAPERFQIEVTETVFLGHGGEGVEQALRILSKAGIRIALDDFGTGYASLSHLKRFPVDILKIDQTFIQDLAQEGEDASIVRAVITLGHNLGMKVIAEGVEDLRQAAYLQAQGCDAGQGYLFNVPVAGVDIAADSFWKRIERDRVRWPNILAALSSPAVVELRRVGSRPA